MNLFKHARTGPEQSNKCSGYRQVVVNERCFYAINLSSGYFPAAFGVRFELDCGWNSLKPVFTDQPDHD